MGSNCLLVLRISLLYQTFPSYIHAIRLVKPIVVSSRYVYTCFIIVSAKFFNDAFVAREVAGTPLILFTTCLARAGSCWRVNLYTRFPLYVVIIRHFFLILRLIQVSKKLISVRLGLFRWSNWQNSFIIFSTFYRYGVLLDAYHSLVNVPIWSNVGLFYDISNGMDGIEV